MPITGETAGCSSPNGARNPSLAGKIARCAIYACIGCGSGQSELEPTQQANSAVVYDADDRRDYYDVQDETIRRLFESYSVVLVSDYRVQSLTDGSLKGIQTWRETEQLCPDEPFAEQPSAASCSGVLVGHGLVLTSRHCLVDSELATTRAVFGYYLQDSEHLALTERDVHLLTSIVASSKDDVDGVDYAWLRFAGETAPNRFPAPTVSSLSPVVEGEPLLAVNSGGGVPLKLNDGGIVIDAHLERQDYFLTDIDAFRGASGSGVFNIDGSLVGIVTSGAADFTRTEDGCRRTVHLSGKRAQEQVMYVHRAIEGLCAVEPEHSLCNPNCEQPCQDIYAPTEHANASCEHARISRRDWNWGTLAGVLGGILAIRRRRKVIGDWRWLLYCRDH